MSLENLQKLLTQPYDRKTFINGIILPVWQGKVDSLVIYDDSRAEEISLTDGEETIAQSVIKYGEIITSDKKTVDLFEVTLQDSKVIERNKVSVGNIVKKHIIGNNAVFASFAYADATDRNWRFSFIAFDSQFEDGDVVQIETNPKRYTYVLGPGESCRTAADRFISLAAKSSIELSHIKEAFSVEKISKDFFNDYREHYQNFCEHLTGKRMVTEKGKQVEKQTGTASPFLESAFGGNEKFARDFAKKLMGRVVFLYFIQKKGWMGASTLAYEDGNLNFMQDFFIASGKGQDFYPKHLSKLFFDTLNNPDRKEDSFTMPDGSKVKIPYLNGGLFEQESDAYAEITFPPALFEELFELFNQYNFTIYEDSPEDHTVAVDPEMLGHIFENLLEDNKDKGAFYTPKQIVHYMTQESLMEYLLTHLSKLTRKDLEPFIKDKVSIGLKPDQLKEIGKLLDKVKICDPAIGSGAFPMGLLQEIFSLKELIAFETGQKWNPVTAKESIIENSIYGVDIEKGAVDIARLRFWLSLVVDELTPKPLPNLDYKIMQGNSLLESYEGIDLSKVASQPDIQMVEPEKDLFGNYVDPQLKITHFKSENAAKIEGLIHKYFGSTSPQEKSKLRKQIDQIVKEHIEYNLELRELQLGRWITDAGKYDNLSNANKKKYDGWQTDLDKIANIRTNLDTQMVSKEKNYFLWHLYFKEVFDQGGFDIIIGNPPYIPAEGLSEFEKILYEDCYQVARGRINVFTIFYELGLKFCSNQGVISLITPYTLMKNKYYFATRDYILNNSKIVSLVDFSNTQIFANAVVDTIILILKKGKHDSYQFKYLRDIRNLLKQDYLEILGSKEIVTATKDLSFNISSYANLILKCYENSTVLEEIIDFKQGIITGDNNTFVTKSRNDFSKPVLSGRDFKRFSINSSAQFVTYDPKKLHRARTKEVFEVDLKILLRQTGAFPIAAIDTNGFYTLDTVHNGHLLNSSFAPHYLICLLNSQLFKFLYRELINEDGKVFAQVKIMYIDPLPIRNCSPKKQDAFIQLAKQIETELSAERVTKNLEHDLDTMVFKLYDLTYEEVLEVLHSTDPDEEFWMSKEEYEGYKLD